MNDEEKQAIEKMQYTIEINQNILDGIEIDEQVIKSMKTTLNLIDKQQKEIERLKQIEDWKNYRVYKNVEDYEIHDKFGKNNLLTKCIHKDKIKEKIKELENLKEQITTNECMLELSASVEILKELLGE